VKALKAAPGRDILVINSATIVHQLLRADLVDDLRFAIVPAIVGIDGPPMVGGARRSLPRWPRVGAGVTALPA
jgi:dihydrofolate reductase